MDMVVRNHFLSHNETKVQRLKRKLGDKEHFSAAHQVLSRPMNVVKSRRGVGTQASVPLRETGIDHCDHHESDEPLVEWIAQAIKANPTNPSGEQVTVPEDVPQHIDSLSDFDTNKNGSAAGPLPNEEHVDNNLQHWHDFEYLPDPLNQYSDPNPMVNTERGTSLPLMPSIPGTSASKDVSLPQKRPTPASVSTHNAHSPQTKPMDETPPHKRRKPAENEVPPPRGSLEDLANLPPSHNIGNFLVNDLLFDLSSTRTHPSDVIEPHEYADMHGVTSHGPPAAGFVEEMTDAEFEALLNTIEDTSTQG
ncbi:hypothetical protein K458DRAFT_147783 [Lentithecium fluviatile CBS 122367]|uniref:Uncharacterized protein n=1 Tax=Lentithecium fluviatile CBS 122367 TaxID=1168545 RepID=A0A6G1JCX9_9PLEO|nr:hypothetical protein K458DRAFT_147783 [Lentithecium fluviatile CBS 122367]